MLVYMFTSISTLSFSLYRAYVDMTGMFDPGVLMQRTIVVCWKGKVVYVHV